MKAITAIIYFAGKCGAAGMSLRSATQDERETGEQRRWWRTERVMDYDGREEKLGGDGENRTADGEQEEKSCFRHEKLQIRAEERIDILLIL